MAAAVFALPEMLRDRSRDTAFIAAGTSGLIVGSLGVAQWFSATPDTRGVIVVSGVAGCVIAGAFTARGVVERLQAAVVVSGATAAFMLYVSMTDRTTAFAVSNLTVAGVAAAVVVGWPRQRGESLAIRGAAAVIGVVLATVGATVQLELVHATTPELYVAAPAIGAILLGAAAMAVWPATPSWALTPGLVAAVLPSLLLALGDDTVRQVAVLAAGGVLVVIGSQLRLAAPLAVGAGSLSLVIVRIAGPQLGRLPHWIALGIVGAVLLALGATWEARVLDVRRASHAIRPRIAALR
jgi:hypothetical protein